jgi:hypothetical protein
MNKKYLAMSEIKQALPIVFFAFFSMQAQAGSITIVNKEPVPITIKIEEWNHCYQPAEGGASGQVKIIPPQGKYKWGFWHAGEWRGCGGTAGQFAVKITPAPKSDDPSCKISDKNTCLKETVAFWFDRGSGFGLLNINPFPGTLTNVGVDYTYTTAAGLSIPSVATIVQKNAKMIVDLVNESGEYTFNTDAKKEAQSVIEKADSLVKSAKVAAAISVHGPIAGLDVSAEYEEARKSSLSNTNTRNDAVKTSEGKTLKLKDDQIRVSIVYGNLMKKDGVVYFEIDRHTTPSSVNLDNGQRGNLAGYFSLVPTMKALGFKMEAPFEGSRVEKVLQ